MTNLRDFQRNDLEVIRDDWWIPIRLVDPDTNIYDTEKDTTNPLLGDVRKKTTEFLDDTGMTVVVKQVSITIRRSDLIRVPLENENWFVDYPDNLLDSGTFKRAAFNYNNVADTGDTLGYIKIYPQEIST